MIKISVINRQYGFWLLEFLISFLIIGVLFVIAVPIYQSYIVRAKIGEVIELTTGVKPSVAEYYSYYGHFPINHDQVEFKTSGMYTTNITIDKGAITGQLKSGNPKLNGLSLTFRPALSENDLPKVIRWTCGYAQPPDHFNIQGKNRTNIPPEYLVSICR